MTTATTVAMTPLSHATSVRASKTTGNEEAPVAFDGETIGVALYDAEPGIGRVLYAGRHAVIGGRIELSVALPVRPAFIVVDPWIRRVDRDRSDNRRRVVLR